MNYKKIYDDIIDHRRNNAFSGYTEKHHILPRSLGGGDDKNNLVNLSAREHYICHLLLTKFYERDSVEYFKMIKAFNLMVNAKSKNHSRDYRVNSRLYSHLKEELSKAMSKSQEGSSNSQYKSFWIYNPILRECKKVPGGFIVSDGWLKGRVTNFDYLDDKCEICDSFINFNKRPQEKRKRCDSCKYKSTQETNNKLKNHTLNKKCYCDGKIYDSVSAASREMKINHETLRMRIKSSNNTKYYYI